MRTGAFSNRDREDKNSLTSNKRFHIILLAFWLGSAQERARNICFICGCSSMVEHQPSKLDTWVRFPSPAFFLLYRTAHGGPSPSGKAQDFDSCIRRFESGRPSFRRRISEEDSITWWVWRSWLARQIVALEAVGSSPTIHPHIPFISTGVCSSAG